MSWIWESFLNFIYELFYYIGVFILKILKLLYQMFRIFAGTKTVSYTSDGNTVNDYLINIFFSNSTITTLYAGMALIGILMLAVMTILAVTKKSFDLGDKMPSMSEILRKTLSSFLFIICMNFIMIVTINFTNTLMESIEYLFDNVYSIGETNSITFNESEYAAMARIYNTIGNYSLNDSYSSRYNVNSCFNDIRGDMQYLENQGVFEFSYVEEVNGVYIDSWQSVLSAIARTHDLSEDMALDEYSDSLSSAILDAMEFAKTNNNEMTVLQSYSKESTSVGSSASDIDVVLFLTATAEAAKNTYYNDDNVSLTDAVRGPYLSGEKSIYNLNQVEEDFSLAFSDFYHLVVIVGGVILCKEFLALCINCVARIFNMLLLYLIAPPFIATAPFDDGSKFKQWSTAFIVQCFSVFGTVISLRLLLILLPIIFDSNLVLMGGGFTELLAKLVLFTGAVYTARKANGLVSGILAENAGYQSIMAGDAASAVKNSTIGKMADGIQGAALSLAGAAGAGAISGAGSVGKSILKSPYTAYKAKQASNSRSALKSTVAKGGSAGKQAASDFLAMDKSSAMKKYHLGDSKYESMKQDMRHALQNMDSAGGGGPTNLSQMGDVGASTDAAGSSDAAKPAKQPPVSGSTLKNYHNS